MNAVGEQCAGKPPALFEVEGAGVIQPFTLHEVLIYEAIAITP